jgi:hypothetical protein
MAKLLVCSAPTRAVLVAVIMGSGALAGCQDPQLKGAKAEVQTDQLKVTLPAVPSFEVPKVNADGSHTIKEMRVAGTKYLGGEVTLHGYVVWAYDCATAIRKSGESDEAVAKRIEEDPMQCRRPAFYLGDDKGTPAERAVWVVEVSRPPTAAEKKNLPKDVIKNWPPVPVYAVGDEVSVTGNWLTTSPHGEGNTDGLLVYESMKNITQNVDTPAATYDPAAPPGTKAAPAH